MNQIPRSIKEMAAEYIEQIRTVQGTGPYHLLGWSLGGIVAQEIAVQLQAEGEQIAALIIMDAYPPLWEAEGEAETAAQPDLADVANVLGREIGQVLTGISDEELAAFAQVIRNNRRILLSHEVRGYTGDLMLIVAAENEEKGISPTVKWKPYVSGEIAESDLPCKHNEMARPEMLAQAWADIATWLGLGS